MLQEEKEYPIWLEKLEQPKKYKLAHELGAGAPCLSCSFCPGLQLHFWRKKCILCACPLDDHDYVDDGYPQYQILFGEKKPKITVLPFNGEPTTFDWVPEQDDESVIAEYMSALPTKWRPIQGTVGSKYRKRQLGRQLPRHDVDLDACLPLAEDEIKRFNNYRNSLRDNTAGLGCVLKLTENLDMYRASPAVVIAYAESQPVNSDLQFASDLKDRSEEELRSKLTEAKICQGCALPLKNNAVVVEARKMENALWHAPCFTCFTCGELLVDLHYFFHDNKVYCGRDYAKAINKPRCSACDELIFEREYTCADGRFYHNRHFCCYVCDQLLGGKQFLNRNENIICPECFQNQNPKICMSCKEIVPLSEHRIQVGSNVYHKKASCFQCGNCKSNLEEGRIYVRGSLLICSLCSTKGAIH